MPRFHLRTVDLDGPVAYAELGEKNAGPTLVLVHGLGGNHLNWLPAAQLLARDHRVLAVDLLGFGRTPTAGRGHGLTAQRDMLARFLREVVGSPATLIGNSMGGLLALMTAAHAPESVSELILVSPALPPAPGALHLEPRELARQLVHLVPGLGELALHLDARRGGARKLFLDLLTLGTRDVSRVPPEVVEANISLIADRMEKQPFGHARSYLDATRSMVLHLAQPSRVHAWADSIAARTLILHGTHDRLVPPAFSRAFVERHPAIELQILEDVGHVPQMEDAAAFVERVRSFLLAGEIEELSPPSRAA
jgi:glycerol-3-phosphate dehydrogenase